MKYKLYWKDNLNNVTNYHGCFDTFESAYQAILDWWWQNDFKPDYVRRWSHGSITTIDYGYHYFFYEIIKVGE